MKGRGRSAVGAAGRVATAAAVALTGCIQTEVPDAPDDVAIAGDTAAGVALELAGPGDAALLVPVYLNGQGPHTFILDTGATLTCVDRELGRALELPEARGRVGRGMGIGGEAGAMRLVEVDSIRVGGASASGLTACELDLAQLAAVGIEASGLLGLNFLTSFRVTLDFARERLLLEPAGGG